MNNEEKKIFKKWTPAHEKLFIEWADKALCYKWLHSKSNLVYNRLNTLYTIPVIIMSTLTGTANFALERVPAEYQDACSIAIGSVNILAGIITTIAQFLKLNELTESHRVAAIAWDKFHRSIRLELIKAPEERIDVTYFMKSSRDEFDRLMETSPNIDMDILNTFKVDLTKSKDKTESIRKLKNFNRLIKPEIFNDIQTLKDVTYKAPPQVEITIEDKVKIKKLNTERDNYKSNIDTVKNFIESFQTKYSRYPAFDEVCSNLKNIPKPDLKIILNDINEE